MRKRGSFAVATALFAALFLAMLVLPSSAQAKAVTSGTTIINIWSEGGSHVQTCDTLRTDINNVAIVNSCTSSFASTCISVQANYMINVTRGGPTNWTNFTVDGCELRLNQSSGRMSMITSWGNLTILNSNVTTNSSSLKSEVNTSVNSNFTMANSFIGLMGNSNTNNNQRGFELNSPSFITNSTIKSNYIGLVLNGSNANGTVINGLTISSTTAGGPPYTYDLYAPAVSNVTLAGIFNVVGVNFLNGVYITGNNNTVANSTTVISGNSGYGIYVSGANSTLYNINATDASIQSNAIYVTGENFTIDLINITVTNGNFNYPGFSLGCNYTAVSNVNATISTAGIAFIMSGNYSTLSNSNVTTTSTGYGIQLGGANNTLSGLGVTSTSSGYGLYLSAAHNNTVNNSNFLSTSTGSVLYLSSSVGNILTNLTSNATGGYAIYLGSNVNGTLVNNVNVTSANSAIYMTGNRGNVISNSFVIGVNTYGINIASGSYGNIVSGNNATATAGGSAIAFQSSYNNTAINNTAAATGGSSIYFYTAYNNTAVNNSISGSGNGVYIAYSNTSMVSGNVITTTTGSAIYLHFYSKNNTIHNNTVSATSGYGVNMATGCFNNTITNTTVAITNGYGIYLTSQCGNNTIANNTVLASSGGFGIYLTTGNNNNTISSFFTSVPNGHGIYISGASNKNMFTDVAINNSNITISGSMNNSFFGLDMWNCSSTAGGCINLLQASMSVFAQAKLNLTRNYMLNAQDANNTFFWDTQFINVTNKIGGINITSTNSNRKSNNNTFLNCSFDGVTESVSGNSQLIRQWYLDVYVNYTNATAVTTANVTILNGTGGVDAYGLVNSSGWVQRMNVTQYTNISGSLKVGNITAQAKTGGCIGGFLGIVSWAAGNGTSGTFTTYDGWTGGDWGGNQTKLSVTVSPLNTSCDGTACFCRDTDMINITGPTNCTGLYASILNTSIVNLCTSRFAANCISVAASMNITDNVVGGNLTLDGCELRINITASGQRFVTSWGNLTIIKSNVSTSSGSAYSELNVSAGSNFSMRDSFVSLMGWANGNNQRGFELNSPSFSFSNNTIRSCYNGLTLNSGANGSVISNLTSFSNTYEGIFLNVSSNNTLSNINASYNPNCGINISRGLNNTLINVTANSNTQHGLYINSNNSAFYNITSNSNSQAGIYVENGNNNTLDLVNATSNNRYGIYIAPGDGNILTNITTNINNYYGVTLWKSGSNALTNVTANSQSSYYGIYILTFSHNNTFNGVTVNSNAQHGILITNSNNNTFTNITVNSNLQYGIYTWLNSNNNTFRNFSIWNCGSSASYACIYLSSNMNNTFERGKINNTQKFLVDITNSNSTLFQDVQFINVTSKSGIINITSNAANAKSLSNTFLNCSFIGASEAVSGNSQLIRQWYLDVYTNYSNFSAAPYVNISVWNGSGILTNYSLTGADGWMVRLNVTQYVNSSGAVSGFANHTIQANISGFTNGSTSWALGNGTSGAATYEDGLAYGDWETNNTRLNFMFEGVASAPFIWMFSPNTSYYNTTSAFLLYINTTADTVWYNYTSGNVTVFGNGTVTVAEGISNLTLWANSTSPSPNNLHNSTPPFTVRVDTQPPNTTIDNTSGSTIPYSAGITIQGTCADDGAAGLHYAYTNNSNFTSVDADPLIFNLTNTSAIPDGNNTVYVFCNDSYGNNLNFSRLSFAMDSAPPTASLTSPAASFYNDSASPAKTVLYCSAADMNALVNVTLYITNSTNESFSANGTANITGTSNSSSWERNLTYGNYTWSCLTFDAYGRSGWGTNRSITINFSDTDSDGLPDINDTLEGNESNVVGSGVGSLNITVGGNTTNGTFSGEQEIVFYDSSSRMLNFTHNFSSSEFNLSIVSITKSSNSVVVNLSGQLQPGYNKTVYIDDNSFASLCVKDAEISSASEISSGCNGDNETDMTGCLGGSLTRSNIVCVDEGTVISIGNMSHSGVRGAPASAPNATAAPAETQLESGCVKDSQCGPLRACFRTACKPVECKYDSDCAGGGYCSLYKCAGGETQPAPAPTIFQPARPPCQSDTQCNVGSGEVCLRGNCVKLFVIAIEGFQSSATVGEFFTFTYYMKGMANVSGDVEVTFWLEKGGTAVTSGKDTIFVGSFDGSTRSSKLLLPRSMESGVYTFRIKLEYGSYSADSYRTVEITVGDEGGVRISEPSLLGSVAMGVIFIVIVVAVIFMVLRLHLRRRRHPWSIGR